MRGFRFECDDCFTNDLCSWCKGSGFHREHSMEEIHKPNNPDVVDRVNVPEAPPIPPKRSVGMVRELIGKIEVETVCSSVSRGLGKIQLASASSDSTTESNIDDNESTSEPAVGMAGELMGRKEVETVCSSVSRGLGAIPLTSASADSTDESETDDSGSTTADLLTTRWSPAESGHPYKRQPVDSSDQEYKTVIANMIAAGGQRWTNKVKQICRIENYRLYKLYKSCKEEMERENGSRFQNESILWHGTSADVLSNIYRDGFNRSYCGKNATAFGDGVYFATLFEYSAKGNYSPPDSKLQKYIFQCRVLTGYFIQGQQGLKEPPMRTHELRYDTVVDNMTSPEMFVIFKDMQVYPEYVITLEV